MQTMPNEDPGLVQQVQDELKRLKGTVSKSKLLTELEDCLTNMLIRPDTGYIFFANIVMKMIKEADVNLDYTAAMTIEKAKFKCIVGPLFLNKYYTFDNRIADLVHEVEHFVRLHTPRRVALVGKTPQPDKAYICNLAMDFEINHGIADIKEKPWSVFPEDYKLPKDKTMEWYYWELLKIQEEQASGKQKQEGGSGQQGESEKDSNQQSDDQQGDQSGGNPSDTPTDSQGRPLLPQPGDKQVINIHAYQSGDGSGEDPVMVEEMTRDLVNEVVKSMGKGNLPSHIQELVNNLNKPRKLNWKDLLRRYVGTAVKARLQKVWTRFNKRSPFLPIKGKKRECGKTIVFVIDTSGSMSSTVINEAINEVKHIKRLSGSVVWLIHCDASVEWSGKIEDFSDLPKKIYGRGGTDFRPAFRWPKEQKVNPDVMVFLTDGVGDYPSRAPRWPLIWLMVEGQKPYVKWGKVVNFPSEMQYA